MCLTIVCSYIEFQPLVFNYGLDKENATDVWTDRPPTDQPTTGWLLYTPPNFVFGGIQNVLECLWKIDLLFTTVIETKYSMHFTKHHSKPTPLVSFCGKGNSDLNLWPSYLKILITNWTTFKKKLGQGDCDSSSPTYLQDLRVVS
jgi:hypothetical protein